MWSRKIVPVALATLAASLTLALPAAARTCEQNFKAIGDPRNGQTFVTELTVPGLKPGSALGQLRKRALDAGNVFVSGDVITPEEGQMYLVQTNLKVPLVTVVTASHQGSVVIGTKLARGQTAPEDGVRTEMCNWLNGLKAGKEGEAIAEAVRVSSGFDKPTVATAVGMSSVLGKETKALQRRISTAPLKGLLSGGNADPDVDAMFQPLIAKYFGRRFIIDGQVYTALPNRMKNTFEVGYLVTKMKGIGGIGGRQANDFNNSNFTVHCALADDQAALAATLRGNDWVKLQGTVDSIDMGGIHLRDCRQVK
ncbi:hypothetical protein [Stenotrophomonas sp.]|uniref:hypothetical protein n=1 Tax=Stenotrophomonas sp. TaxID=69392 RepID=UPI002FCBC7BB